MQPSLIFICLHKLSLFTFILLIKTANALMETCWCVYLLQSSMSASLRPSLVWMCSVRPSLGWGRRQCLSWPPCSSWSPSLDRWSFLRGSFYPSYIHLDKGLNFPIIPHLDNSIIKYYEISWWDSLLIPCFSDCKTSNTNYPVWGYVFGHRGWWSLLVWMNIPEKLGLMHCKENQEQRTVNLPELNDGEDRMSMLNPVIFVHADLFTGSSVLVEKSSWKSINFACCQTIPCWIESHKRILTVTVTVLLQVSVLVMCRTRKLAFQISKKYEKLSKYMPTVKVKHFLLCNVLWRAVYKERWRSAEEGLSSHCGSNPRKDPGTDMQQDTQPVLIWECIFFPHGLLHSYGITLSSYLFACMAAFDLKCIFQNAALFL